MASGVRTTCSPSPTSVHEESAMALPAQAATPPQPHNHTVDGLAGACSASVESSSCSIPAIRTVSQALFSPEALSAWRDLRVHAAKALSCLEEEGRGDQGGEKTAIRDLLQVLLRFGKEDEVGMRIFRDP